MLGNLFSNEPSLAFALNFLSFFFEFNMGGVIKTPSLSDLKKEEGLYYPTDMNPYSSSAIKESASFIKFAMADFRNWSLVALTFR